MDAGPRFEGRIPRWLIGVGILLALGSLSVGVYNALGSTVDFQWSPAKLLWRGINPYAYFLLPEHPEIILFQAPNYGHLLYVLLWPYVQLEWMHAKIAWAITNMAFLGVGLWLLSRTLTDRLARHQFLVTALLLCIGFTARNVVANGQQTLIVFIALVLFLVYREKPLIAGLALALLLMKYSFGLQIVLLAFVLGYYRAVIVSIVVTAAAIAIFGALCDSSGMPLVLGPVTVARVATAVGFGDLLSLGRRLTGGDPLASLPLVALSVGLNLGFFGYMKYQLRGRDHHDLRTVALLLGATVYLSLGTIYHLKYDYLTVMVPLYAFILTGVLRPKVFLMLLIAHFLVYWMLPRHDFLFLLGAPSNVLVTAILLTFLALAAFSLRAAFRLGRRVDTRRVGVPA